MIGFFHLFLSQSKQCALDTFTASPVRFFHVCRRQWARSGSPSHVFRGMSLENSLGNSQGCHFKYPTMGDGSFGSIFVSFLVPVHSNGRCVMLPGFCISSTASSVDRSTARCVSLSPGFPMVCPNGCSIPASRGTLTADVRSGTLDKVMVVMPLRSTSRCANPTDQQQTGQAGMNTATSTLSCRRCSMIAGTLF